MIFFPAECVPGPLSMLHIGCGPDAFIAHSGWIPNYLATGLYDLDWMAPSRDQGKADLVGANFSWVECGTDYVDLLDLALQSDPDTIVCITTETAQHCENICACIKAGAKYIIVDKPMVASVAEALQVQKLAKEAGAYVFVTYNHQFCAPVHQMRRLVQTVGASIVETWFFQSWLDQNHSGMRQFDWRTSERLCSPRDIWSHAENLASFILSSPMCRITDVELRTGGEHGQGDILTGGSCLAHFESGARATVEFDQARQGHQDDIGAYLRLNDGRHVMWRLELGPDNIWISNEPSPDPCNLGDWQHHMRGDGTLDPDIDATFDLTPPGHHQGWNDMWRYLFTAIAGQVYRSQGLGLDFNSLPAKLSLPVPGIHDGLQTARFVEAAVKAHDENIDSVSL